MKFVLYWSQIIGILLQKTIWHIFQKKEVKIGYYNNSVNSNELVCLEVTVRDDDLDIADDQEEVPDHYEALVRVLTVGENIYEDDFLCKIYFIMMSHYLISC